MNQVVYCYEDLPDDVGLLKNIILDLQKSYQQKINILEIVTKEQQAQILQLTEQVKQLSHTVYGRKSEKRNRSKNAEPQQPIEPPIALESTDCRRKRSGRARSVWPENLPREQRYYDIPENEKICQQCQQAMQKISETVTEQLEIIPAQYFIIEHTVPVYACSGCKENIIKGNKPPQLIGKGIPGPRLLAEIIADKYSRHLPLYRQEQHFQYAGLPVNRSTMCGWIKEAAFMLEYLVDRMRIKALIPSGHIFMDDTPFTVIQDGGKKGYLWVMVSKKNALTPGCVIYAYSPSHHRDHPMRFLEGFSGYLQADAFAGYNILYDPERLGKIIEVACWAHVRRKFVDAERAGSKIAQEIVRMIGQLYTVEHKAKEMTDKQRYELRQQVSASLLTGIHKVLVEYKKVILPGCLLSTAINYALNNWQALVNYTLDGKLEIDNNLAERKIKPTAIGRKNWLFFGSDQGGRQAAILYSIVETCRYHGVNVSDYLTDLFSQLPNLKTSQIEDYLPYNWKGPPDLRQNLLYRQVGIT